MTERDHAQDDPARTVDRLGRELRENLLRAAHAQASRGRRPIRRVVAGCVVLATVAVPAGLAAAGVFDGEQASVAYECPAAAPPEGSDVTLGSPAEPDGKPVREEPPSGPPENPCED